MFFKIITYTLLFLLVITFLVFQNNSTGRVNSYNQPQIGSGVLQSCRIKTEKKCLDKYLDTDITIPYCSNSIDGICIDDYTDDELDEIAIYAEKNGINVK